ncbi:hypothetical protein ACJ3XI_10930 [Litorimonas sp. RW-G-Af-16]|uniref:hypothetical protein n=1 Tax=Litorimonas sp. RW-G-Af-16 TaxID=3241168 RepID=UPI00390CD59F
MNPLKTRQILITLHLLFAGFMAPAFILMAITGGNYLLGIKGSSTSETLNVPAAASLNFNAPTIESDVRAALSAAGIEHKFEYVKSRGEGKIHLRPTSRPYLELTSDGVVKRITPSPQKAMMELHMGHGPQLFKTYQKFVALALILVILGGVFVGLLAKAYRRITIASLAVGTLVFVLLAFVI